MFDLLATLALLIGLELVLGVDNILVISILVGRLPPARQNQARIWGLSLAFTLRIFAIILLVNVAGIKDHIFLNFSARDLVLLFGGMFLLWKAIREIHHTLNYARNRYGRAQYLIFHSIIMAIT
ncbi:MAG: hypothetical protein Q8P24_04445 [Desulfobacterales bacterium]|nr:hypothetical protein [Desulfobacterales bacterium]